MEYRLETDGSWTPAPESGTLTGLAAGAIVQVRTRALEPDGDEAGAFASLPVQIKIGLDSQPQPTPEPVNPPEPPAPEPAPLPQPTPTSDSLPKPLASTGDAAGTALPFLFGALGCAAAVLALARRRSAVR